MKNTLSLEHADSLPVVFARRWRELASFALLFRLVESLLFAPMAALAGQWLLGRTVLDSTAVVSFLLSPRGFIALALAAITALCIRLLEHAGLAAIFFQAFDGRRVSGRQALRLVGRTLPDLLHVSARFVVAGLLTVTPLLAVAGAFAARLLPRHDINYYLKLHPPEFMTAAAVIGVVTLLTAAVLLWLVVRWRWVVQAVLFQGKQGRDAFVESAALTRDRRWKLASALVGVTAASGILGLLAPLIGDGCTFVVLGFAGNGTASLALSFGVLVLIRTVVGAVCTFLGSCVDAGVFTRLYRRRAAEMDCETSLTIDDSSSQAPRLPWLPWATAVGLLLIAGSGAWVALEGLPIEPHVTIHAHRGVTTRAPENTLAAVRDAIAAGADYVETDVQLSKDGVLVVAHDSDFSRLGGVARKVWDLTYDEIRAIPLGGRAAPEFRNEVAPTFDALLAEAKGRIRVNIELKYYGDHQPGLARKVVEAVRTRGMLDQVVIQCLEYEPLMEARQLAPEVPVGYLLSFNARRPARLEVDFLSVEQNRLDRRFIQSAHRRGQQVYAWTVNKETDMNRLLDLGIDGMITDQAGSARATVTTYRDCPPAQRTIRRLRSWLEN